ncbi:substrate-binding domain-containing protein [Planococcus sp. ISL-109]|nr:substrate-binding domain-containing protein [Planococcus sp. ISL-109]
MVFFVHAENPVDALSTADIQAIYSGKQTNWSALGGEDQPIRAFQRPEDSVRQTALLNFMGDVPVMRAPIENMEEGMGGIIEQVAEYKNHSNAIGFTFRFYGGRNGWQ